MGARRSGPVEVVQLTLGGNSAATATTTAYTAVTDLHDFEQIKIVATLKGTDGTVAGGTLDVYVQFSADAGVTWWDYMHFPQVASGAAAVSYSYCPALNDSLLTIGSGTLAAPGVAQANASVAGGCWGDQLRMVIVTGAGCNHAVAQVVNVVGVRPTRLA